ncbi:MAG: hypothetical protein ACP5US_04480 [Candidatus Kryptoniota bacterium]
MTTFIEIVKLQLLKSFRRRGFKGVIRFLIPELLAGVLVSVAVNNNLSGQGSGFIFQVIFSTSLYILITESRKVFLIESDTEGFYFSPPTLQYHVAVFMSFVVISILVTAAVAAVPFFLSGSNTLFYIIVSGWLSSLNVFFVILIFVGFAGKNYVKFFLILFQIFSGIALLAVLESVGRRGYFFMNVQYIPVMLIALSFLFSCFVFSSTTEKISDGLSTRRRHNFRGLDKFPLWARRVLLLNRDNEFAGFLFMVANFSRDHTLRLTLITLTAMPYVAALYSLLSSGGIHGIDSMIKPMISVIAVGIFSYYFLSESITVSSYSEGRWFFRAMPSFNAQAFINGCRKASVVFVHIPATLLVFTAALSVCPFAYALLFVLSYHSFTYTALAWYFAFTKNFPLSISFKTLGASSISNLFFAFGYSFISIWALLMFGIGIKELILLDFSILALFAIIKLILPFVLNRQRIAEQLID